MLLQIPFSLPPEIFTLGPLSVRWYGLCWASGFAIGYFVMQRIFKREGENEAWLDWLLLILVLCSVLGARLGHVLFYELPSNPDDYLSRPWEALMFWNGGMASHGGFIGLVLAFFIFAKWVSKKPVLWGSDRVVLPTAITAGLIRVGNFFNSEIVGNFTDVPWAIQFVLRGETMGRHPAQLYEAICYFGIAAFLFYLYFRKEGGQKLGFLTGVFLTLTFTARFLVEFLKPAQEAFEESILLNMGQWLSIPIVLFGLWLIWRSSKGDTASQNA